MSGAPEYVPGDVQTAGLGTTLKELRDLGERTSFLSSPDSRSINREKVVPV